MNKIQRLLNKLDESNVGLGMTTGSNIYVDKTVDSVDEASDSKLKFITDNIVRLFMGDSDTASLNLKNARGTYPKVEMTGMNWEQSYASLYNDLYKLFARYTDSK